MLRMSKCNYCPRMTRIYANKFRRHAKPLAAPFRLANPDSELGDARFAWIRVIRGQFFPEMRCELLRHQTASYSWNQAPIRSIFVSAITLPACACSSS